MEYSLVNSLSDSEKTARIRLALTQNVGAITFRDLLARFGTAVEALDSLPQMAAASGRKHLNIPSLSSIEPKLDALKAFGGELVVLGDKNYPEILAATDDAPPFLTAKGRLELLANDSIAIVGARNASAMGQKFSRMIASALGKAGLVITSGLARGIDGAAHTGALETGTVAVLGGGLDVYYPPENHALQDKISETGLLLSEHFLGTRPQANHFPRRNRIISGLSLGIMVVEAALRSGSLITARLAGEQGRDVFAVPGSPLDPRSSGANKLIRDGAILVESVEDILDAIQNRSRTTPHEMKAPASIFEESKNPDPVKAAEVDGARSIIAELLAPSPIGIDELVQISKLPSAIVMHVILELELAGTAARHAGGKVSLKDI